MRIVFLSHYSYPHVGGIEFVVDRLARELVARGHEVTHVAAATESNSGHLTPYRQALVPASQMMKERFALPYPVSRPYAMWKTASRALDDADVVHAHGMLYQSCVTAFAASRWKQKGARILTEHVGHVPYDSSVVDVAERLAIATIGRFTARSADAIITLNDRVTAEMKRLAPGRPIHHIDNGVDLETFHPARADERHSLRDELQWDSKPRVLFVGRLVEKKGILLAIEAANRAQGGFELVVVGPGSLQGADLPPNVHLMGELTHVRLASLYRAADAFLLPSRGEGFPLTVQEAMASGLPVVLLDDPVYRPLLEGSGQAVRVAPPDPSSLATTVMEAIADRARSGRDAAEFAARRFNWGRTVDLHLEIYRSHIEGRG